MSSGYHHGALRDVLLSEAATVADESGPGALALRELARRAGVSHAAPAYHFGDRRGLLTALAAQSLDMMADAVRDAAESGFEEAAVAYVHFAREHPGRYAVVHAPDLLDGDDVDFRRARAASMAVLLAGVESIPPERRTGLTTAQAATVAWSLVHGLASLPQWAASEAPLDDDFIRRAARQLFS